ncbi:MAG: hypothetical protein ACTSRK_09770 [Promethearchaeota archaeon]
MIKIDASSLIYSIKMDFLEIIERLYGDLIITPEIYKEVVKKGMERGKPDAFILKKRIEQKKISIHQIEGILPDFHLGKGETEIIHEALNEKVTALIDDKKARVIGSKLGLNVKNIPFILIEGLLTKQIKLDDFDIFFQKWILIASPSQDHIYFINQIKNTIVGEKNND